VLGCAKNCTVESLDTTTACDGARSALVVSVGTTVNRRWLVAGPFRDKAVNWAWCWVAANVALEGRQWQTTIGRVDKHWAVLTTGAVSARSAADRVDTVVCIGPWSPLTDNGVNWARIWVAGGSLGEGGAGLSTKLGNRHDGAGKSDDTTTASDGAGSSFSTIVIGIVWSPLADGAVLWALLWVATDWLGQSWASETTVQGMLEDLAHQVASSVSASSRADTIKLVSGLSHWVVSPASNDTVNSTSVSVARDLLGQRWTSLAAVDAGREDLTIDCADTTTARDGA